ncbi:MAG TPA: tetratricopeptide repeat protein [Thermoanaerobaculia bacterium]|nr:tetratricopeptide repeat protein [Thermoanaerobaculia bacterium]
MIESRSPHPVYCQACGAGNPDDQEFCRRCHHKLLVVSGSRNERDDLLAELEEDFSFDEHLLERISLLEEAVKRSTETVEHLLGVVQKQEENLAMAEAGLATVRELLERKQLVTREEWELLWGRRRDQRLLALEKRDRFQRLRERIVALHQGGRQEEFLRFLEEASKAFSALELDRAIEALEGAARLDRDNHELVHLLGECLFHNGELPRALGWFDRLLELKPGHFEGLVYGGVIRHEAGDVDGASKLLQRAVELHGESFLPHFSLGAVYASQGDPARAAQHLERAVGIEAVPQALFLLGRCWHELGQLGPAIRCLRDAVGKSPLFEEAHYQLGLVYLDRRWNRKALDAFRRAQRLNPRKFRYTELVRYLGEQGASPFPPVSGEAAAALRQGEAALDGDRLDEAYRCFRRALKSAPDHPAVLTYYALACLALDRPQEIEAVVRRVAGKDPGEMLLSTAYATWIEALREQGRLAEGNRLGEELLAAGSGNFAKTIAYYEMAWNLAEMEENLDEALEFARRAVDLAPEELQQFPLAALGWVHYKRKEYSQAVEFLARASQLGSSASTLTQLGMALLASGDEEQARRTLERARSLRGRGQGLEFKMMECLRDSNRFHSRLRVDRTLRGRSGKA